MPNRLIHEQSLYLKSHAHNPVDWYPWEKEALERARKEDKPILLSIGYSACHWCHVMAHESFENAQIAKVMNENFINIKVDREERPDLDQIYQNVAQLFTHSGGWPLTVFLTPELKPFFGGTYFPPDDRYGRPGFLRVLGALSEAYHTQKEDVSQNAEKITEQIIKLESLTFNAGKGWSLELLKTHAQKILSHFDWQWGGVQGAPKFPMPSLLMFLWRIGWVCGLEDALTAVKLTLVKMAQGGMYDQLRGGFHRYSVDEYWGVPHFEKMLYDQGGLIQLYAEVLLTVQSGKVSSTFLSLSERELFFDVLSQTVQYLKSEMQAPEGFFYAAQDADIEGHEGKTYIWSKEEIEKIVGADEARVFCLFYGVTQTQDNVLKQSASVESVAETLNVSPMVISQWIKQGKEKLLEARLKREQPLVDKKILVSWNALLISGLSWASQALAGRPESALAHEMAHQAWKQILIHFKNEKLPSVLYAEETPRFSGYLDDYAFLAKASLDLYRFSDQKEEFLNQGVQLLRSAILQFLDSKQSGFFFTPHDHEELLERPKTLFDQSTPSGMSVLYGTFFCFQELGVEFLLDAPLTQKLTQDFEGFSSVTSSFGLGELFSSALFRTSGLKIYGLPKGEDLNSELKQLVGLPLVFIKNSSTYVFCHQGVCQNADSQNKLLSLSKKI